MILLATFGPALLTVAFSISVFGLLYVLGFGYTREQIEWGTLFFFVCWQITAIWWLWRNWKSSKSSGP